MSQGIYRVQNIYARSSPVAEDVAVIDWGFAHVPGTTAADFAAEGAIDDTFAGLVAADATALANFASNINPWLTSVKVHQCPNIAWNELKVNRWDSGHPTPNLPVFTSSGTVTGTGTGTMPPQVAISHTLRVAARRHWGRFYLPGISVDTVDTYGRIDTDITDDLLSALITLYSDMADDDWYPVVLQAGGLSTGACRTVTSFDIDNVYDVIRRRRYDRSTFTSEHTIS